MARTRKSTRSATIKKGKGRKKGTAFFPISARRLNFKAQYSTTLSLIVGFLAVFLLGLFIGFSLNNEKADTSRNQNEQYWLILERGEGKEFLYYGTAGDKDKSRLIREFVVKTGVPGERPTPLPLFFGKDYWKIVKKYSSYDNPETAPYFLELDIPIEDGYFGPVPYPECNGQCLWEIPGYFGLHGVNGDESKLSEENAGSSGCIRHKDEDIAYLYNLLDVNEGVRYYINP